MLRVVLVLVGLLAAAYLFLRVWKELAGADVDWKGVTVAAGFVALAFYLSHVTGITGIADAG